MYIPCIKITIRLCEFLEFPAQLGVLRIESLRLAAFFFLPGITGDFLSRNSMEKHGILMLFSHLMYGKHMKHMRMNLPNLPSHENFERFGTSEPVDWTLRTHILWMNLQSNDQGIWGWSQNRYPQI